MGGGDRIPAMDAQATSSDPVQNVNLHAVVDLGRYAYHLFIPT
jgi:hypothetical protein